jgi:drug/metabolite transporter (DMT)-like permease
MNRKLLLYIVPLVFLWGGFAGVVLRPLQRLPVPMVLFLNLASGLAFMTLYMAFTGRFRVLETWPRALWGKLIFAGMFGSFIYYALCFYGYKTAGNSSAIEVSMMNFLFPITTVIFSAFLLRERVTPLGVLSIVISFAGAYVILTRGDLLSLRIEAWEGLLLGFLAAVSWGIFSALGRKWAPDPIAAVFVYYAAAVILSAGWLIITPGEFLWPTWEEAGCMAYAGILSNCVGVILWFKALQVSNATLVGNLTYSAAFLNVLGIYLSIGSPIRPSSIVGLCLVTVGVLVASRYGHVGAARQPAELK